MARRKRGGDVLRDALAGAGCGLAASFIMDRLQPRIMALGSERTKAREREAQAGQAPATEQVADAAAHLAGRSLDERRRRAAGAAVHYAYGAAWGAAFGVLAGRVRWPAVATGLAFGAAVWLLSDEILVPALRFSRGPSAYPPSAHAKALASHLVYGAATDSSYRLLRLVLH